MEIIKKASRGLRGTLVESLHDPLTGAIRDSDTQLIKFHGSYMQDDRDLRAEREHQKLEPAYSFMIRTRTPGGVLHAQAVAGADRSSRARTRTGTLRLTTRQAFQLHGVIKKDLKATMQAHERRAHRFHRRLRRRESQRHGQRQPGREPAARGSLRVGR